MRLVMWLLVGVVLSLATAARAQQTPVAARRSAVVTLAGSDVVLDGLLDEPAWAAVEPIGDLVQRQPNVGQAPSERTVVKLLRDANNLYIGVIAYDSDPNRIVATQMARDAGLGSDDRIEIVFDTFRDQRNAFYFATNPAGTYVDGIAFVNGDLNTEWDTIWDVRTRRSDEGWTAEFSIPFKSLNFPVGQSVWGFNLARSINRKLEEDRWAGARLDVTRFAQVSEAGEISGLDGLTQGRGLDLRPFIAGRRLDVRSADSVLSGKPGFNLFYNVTSSLKLSATVNTDFGETEVDNRQINLSRFSLLFPERRQFFLEDVGVFSFASTGPDPAAGIPGTGAEVFPFFSRQIGLLRGQEVPLDVGIKFTGKVGQTDIGFLDVRTRDVAISDARNFVIGRVRQNFSQQSYVGAIVTDGNPNGAASSRTVGADLRLATSRFLGRPRNLVMNAYGLRTINEGVTDKDWSYGFSVAYPNDRYGAQFVVREIQQNFNPGVGFVQRGNVRMMRTAFSFNPRPRQFLNLQQMFHDFYYTRFVGLDNNKVVSQDFYMTLLDWHARTGDSWHGLLDVNVVNEHLYAPFTISPGVVLPVGEYTFTRFRSNLLTSATRRKVSANLTASWGDYWSGTANQVQAGIAFRLPPRFNVNVSTNQTFAKLPEGNFTARIVTMNLSYNASARVSLANQLQYDNRSRNLGWQTRVRWTLRPGDDVFVSFNQGWVRDAATDDRFRGEDNKLAVKLQYAFRF